LADTALNVTVTGVFVGDVISLILVVPTDNVTVGRAVSSTIVTVTDVPIFVALVTVPMSITTVSSSSSNGSSFVAVRITDDEESPAEIVIVVVPRVKSVEEAVLEDKIVNGTVTSLAEIVLSVAVTVVLVADVFS